MPGLFYYYSHCVYLGVYLLNHCIYSAHRHKIAPMVFSRPEHTPSEALRKLRRLTGPRSVGDPDHVLMQFLDAVHLVSACPVADGRELVCRMCIQRYITGRSGIIGMLSFEAESLW